MDTKQRVVNLDSGGCRGRGSGSLLVLVLIDVMAFAVGVSLALGAPEAFDTAASSANAGAVMASGNPAFHQRHRQSADPQAIMPPPTF